MEQRSQQRELRTVDPAWNLSELMARIAKALASDGPALALAPTKLEMVSERTVLVVTTTGSSGIAKEIALSASALLASAKSSNAYLKAEFGNTWSLLLPLNHIAGINVLIRSLELGTHPINLLGYEGKFPKVDFTAIVPTQLFRALNGDTNLLEHLKSARAVLVGGAALTSELRAQATEAGIDLVETYGSTETSGGCVYNGTPLDGIEIKIGKDDQIAIKGKAVADDLIDSDGWFYTSDAGHLEDGKLVIDGRIDDVVITGGENISLAAIERILAASFPQFQSAAFAVPDNEWGQAIHIAIAGGDSSLESKIQSVLEREISSAAKAKGFHHLSELPLIGIGKVDRVALVGLVHE
ncbi:MAG: AMP-binding protein [Actinobacteria bacterium]|nr:AMP-binding protein [Actinomycetota bacterium]